MSGKATDATQAQTAPPAREPDGSEWLSKRIGLLATIIGIFVTLNTLVTSCTNASVSHASGYRAAMRTEEEFWSGLYERYLKVVEQPPADLEQRRARLMAIAMMAGRQPARFDEYSTWYSFEDPVDETAIENLLHMRGAIHSALADPSVSSREIAADIGYYLGQQNDNDVQERERGAGDGGEPPPTTGRARRETIVTDLAQPAAPAAGQASGSAEVRPVYGNAIVAVGASNGWDIDVFWCTGEGWSANYVSATAVANALAEAASEGQAIGGGVNLGRVRLRSLPPSARHYAYYDRQAPTIIYDSGAGEKDAAGTVARFVAGRRAATLGPNHSSGAATPWYLSVFMCGPRPA